MFCLQRLVVVIFVASVLAEKDEEVCQKDTICGLCSLKEDKVIKLSEIEDEIAETESRLFFIESSNRTYLLPRQVCAVESALEKAEIDQIYVIFTAELLKITGNNATCQLYQKYPNIKFRHVNLNNLFQDTPIYEPYKSGLLQKKAEPNSDVHYKKEHLPVVNLSDAIRLVLIYKYGGWYSDTDMVFLKSIKEFKNVAAADDYDERELKRDPTYIGKSVSNAIFHFDKQHVFLNVSLQLFPHIFNGVWGSGGPQIFKQARELLCKGDNKNCDHLLTLPPK